MTVTTGRTATATRAATRIANVGRIYLSALRAGWADYRTLYTWRSWLFGWVLRVVSQVAFFAVVGHLLGSPQRLQFLLIGNAVAIAVMETLMAMSFLSAERRAGTLPLIVAAGSSPILVLAGRTAFLMGTATASASIALFAAAALFGIEVPWRHAWAIVVLIATVAVAGYCLALFITALAMKFLQLGTLLNGIVFLPMLALCGAVVPVGYWPAWLGQLSGLLPLTHGLAGVRALFDGAGPAVLGPAAGAELVVAAGWLLLAAGAFRFAIWQGRRTGDLDHA